MKRTGMKERILALHDEHPDWTAPEIARHLNACPSHTRQTLLKGGREVARGTGGQTGRNALLSPAEVATVFELRADGLIFPEIADRMGCSVTPVATKHRKLSRILDVTPIRWNDELDGLLDEFRRRGRTPAQIGEILGITETQARGRIAYRQAFDVTTSEASDRAAATDPGAHLRDYKRVRRGGRVVPDHLEQTYVDLLKTGMPVAQALERVAGASGS